MKVVLLSHTPDPERTIALAARLCYSPKSPADLSETMSNQEVDRVLNTIINQGHGSALEHASFTFGIEGVSRACTHQLVRHRLASYNQQSQRYVDESKCFDYVIPQSIENYSGLYFPQIKEEADGHARGCYRTELKEAYADYMEIVFRFYKRMVEEGIPKEDARYILPNAVCSNIVVTMNVRELLHFFNLRTCNRAQWEIREVAEEMLKLCKEVSPKLFKNAGPDCITGQCHEGKMSCGHPRNGEL